MSRKWWLRVVVIVYMGIYSFYALKSVAFAFSYIGKPIVRSNYELMKIGPEFCRGEDSKLFVGRDESSAYFLVDCENINFAYDRFSNNAAFWEVIALNKLSSLDQKCGVDSWKLTAIDFSLYEKVLIDKCFKFENNSFRLVKEFDGYRWYEKVR